MRESVVIGKSDRVEEMLRVTVLEVIRGKVRLGFEAADGVAVHRSEVWEKIRNSGVPREAGQARAVPVVPALAVIAEPRGNIQ
jgi:carbon storage regulator CsrA